MPPTKLIDLDLAHPLPTLSGLADYDQIQALVRLHGYPIGIVKLPVTCGYCYASHLGQAILGQLRWPLVRQLLNDRLAADPAPQTLAIGALLQASPPLRTQGSRPSLTVAVCVTESDPNLSLCLAALQRLDANLEVLVIDNTLEGLEQPEGQYPGMRWLREARQGIGWARNRAIRAAQGELIAYLSSRTIVDADWASAVSAIFQADPTVMAVTGLVLPYELETPVQQQFEVSGWGRGCDRQWFQIGAGERMPRELLAHPWRWGTGVNMVFRRALFEQIGEFKPDLSGVSSELELFFRLLKAGQVLVYEPGAIGRYCYPSDPDALLAHHRDLGSASAYLQSGWQYSDERLAAVQIGLWWTRTWHLKGLLRSLRGQHRLPLALTWAELQGAWQGLTARSSPAADLDDADKPTVNWQYQPAPPPTRPTRYRTAVRTVELTQPIEALTDVEDYRRVRLFVTWQGAAIGQLDLWNHQRAISALRLRDAIVTGLGYRLLDLDQALSGDLFWASLIEALHARYLPTDDPVLRQTEQALPRQIPVSIIVGTYDRPDDLRNCLSCLVVQQTDRPLEIIVTDNHPASGLTAPVVAEFAGVKYVSETRQGAAYARNAGIVASRGEIVVTVDDDTTIPPDWLEKLLSPFVRPDVMLVTGNVLPRELETASQRIFEGYGCGGLGRGFNRFEAAAEWFHNCEDVVPTWLFGGTANAAFRASLFSHPAVGLLDEALGPGMPSGVGEDIYIFYRTLKAGFTIVYEPTAFVWHTHRRDMRALRRQLYNYSKGYVSYNLTTWRQDQDRRVLPNLLFKTPKWHFDRIRGRLQGVVSHPIRLVLLEFAGHLAGPWSLWQSRRRVQQLGFSQPYIPVAERDATIDSRTDAIPGSIANSIADSIADAIPTVAIDAAAAPPVSKLGVSGSVSGPEEH